MRTIFLAALLALSESAHAQDMNIPKERELYGRIAAACLSSSSLANLFGKTVASVIQIACQKTLWDSRDARPMYKAFNCGFLTIPPQNLRTVTDAHLRSVATAACLDAVFTVWPETM